MIAKAKVDALTHELVDYLMGETDNIPKEPQYTFKLYRAIGNTGQAVKIAVNIAQQEQEKLAEENAIRAKIARVDELE